MLRITPTLSTRSLKVFNVEGRLAGDELDVLERICREALRDTGAVRLDLRDIQTLDAAGAATLRRLERLGVELEHVPPFPASLPPEEDVWQP